LEISGNASPRLNKVNPDSPLSYDLSTVSDFLFAKVTPVYKTAEEAKQYLLRFVAGVESFISGHKRSIEQMEVLHIFMLIYVLQSKVLYLLLMK